MEWKYQKKAAVILKCFLDAWLTTIYEDIWIQRNNLISKSRELYYKPFKIKLILNEPHPPPPVEPIMITLPIKKIQDMLLKQKNVLIELEESTIKLKNINLNTPIQTSDEYGNNSIIKEKKKISEKEENEATQATSKRRSKKMDQESTNSNTQYSTLQTQNTPFDHSPRPPPKPPDKEHTESNTITQTITLSNIITQRPRTRSRTRQLRNKDPTNK